MKRIRETDSSNKEKRTSNTPSTCNSVISNSNPCGNNSKALQSILDKQQSALTSQLVAYSQILLKKVPETAKRLEGIELRLCELVSAKENTKKLVEERKIEKKRQKSLRVIEKSIMKIEKVNIEERTELENCLCERDLLEVKRAEIEKLERKKLFLGLERENLVKRLEEIRNTKGILGGNLEKLRKAQKNLYFMCSKQKDLCEEIMISKEEVLLLKKDAQTYIAPESQSESTEKISNTRALQADLEFLKEKYYKLSTKNHLFAEELQKNHDKLKAKFALLSLEDKYISSQRKKNGQYKSVLVEIASDLNKYSLALKKPPISQRRHSQTPKINN